MSANVYAFEGIARPVLFEQDGEYSYWGKGSSMLLANAKHYFWITAKHVLSNMGGSAQALRIFPFDGSRISLPFNEQYTIKTEGLEDEDYKDVVALRIDLAEFEKSGDAPLVAQDVESGRGLMEAEALSPNDRLWIIGYPAESNFIDFDAQRIQNTRSVIRAAYKGYSVSAHCHTAKIETSIVLSSFDGLSGSPVFYMRHVGNVQFPLIVGMLLRGTVESGLVHFVSARVIGNLIQLAGGEGYALCPREEA